MTRPRIVRCSEGDLATLLELSGPGRAVLWAWGIPGGLIDVPENRWAIELVEAGQNDA